MNELTEVEKRIIEAARQVFVRKGFEASTMSDIAAETGIGRTAMHYYYRTKELLFDAVFDQLLGALLPNISRVVDQDTSCLDKIPELVDIYVAIVQVNPLLPIFLVNELNRDPQHVYQTILKKPERINSMLLLRKKMEEEMEAGTLKKQPLIYVVSTLISLVIFPMLIRNPLTTLFLEDDVTRFDAFLEGRKPFITGLMLDILRPDTN